MQNRTLSIFKNKKAVGFFIAFFCLALHFLVARSTPRLSKYILNLAKPQLLGKQPTNDTTYYQEMVYPIFKAKCISCHNDTRLKGGLSMVSFEKFAKGGKQGMPWDAHALDLGLLMRLINLPEDDNNRMPPAGLDELTTEEKEIISIWIKAGASPTVSSAVLKKNSNKENEPPKRQKVYPNCPAVADSLLKGFSNEFRLVQRLDDASNAIGVSFFTKAFFKNEMLYTLATIKNNVVELNLNRMPVTDEEIKFISTFQNLQKLNLAGTFITNTGLGYLANLSLLESLVLSSTKVNIEGLSALQKLPLLNELFLWNTTITNKELESAKKQLSHTNIDFGFKGDTIQAILPAPVLVNEHFVFKDSLLITLSHCLSQAKIKYTLDGSNPDSNGMVYNKPFAIKSGANFKAKAYLQGWLESPLIVYDFYKAILKFESETLFTKPNPNHLGEGAKSIVDGFFGDLVYDGEEYLGYIDTNFHARITLLEPKKISTVTFSTILVSEERIFPADSLVVKIIPFENLDNTTPLFYSIKPTPLDSSQANITIKKTFTIQIPNINCKAIEVFAYPAAKLPSWHVDRKASKNKCKFFVDEVLVY